MDWLLVFVIAFFAGLTQSVTGFGASLVSMPLLVAVLGIRLATPLVAFFVLALEIALLFIYRDGLNLRVVWRLAVASVLGVPLGIFLLRIVDERVVLFLLGLVVAGYAAYSLLKYRLPVVRRRVWAYGAGFVAGVLGGAYNTPGPAVVIYGDSSRWPPAAFKSNLQGFFVLNSIVVLAAHLLAGNYRAEVWQNALVAVPGAAVGIIAGVRLTRRLDPVAFRKLVLWLLLLLGVRLLLP